MMFYRCSHDESGDDINVQIVICANTTQSIVGTELVTTGSARIEDSSTFICRS